MICPAKLRNHEAAVCRCTTFFFSAQSMWRRCIPGMTLDNQHRLKSTSTIDFEWKADEARARKPCGSRDVSAQHLVALLDRRFMKLTSLTAPQIEPVDKSNNRRRDEMTEYLNAQVRFKGMMKSA